MLEYPSNITKEQLEIIRENLDAARKTTKPHKLVLQQGATSLINSSFNAPGPIDQKDGI